MKVKSVPGMLANRGVPVQDRWAKNGAWSVQDLQAEISANRSTLIELPEIGLVRRVLVVELNVFMLRDGVMETLRATVPTGKKMSLYTRLIQMKLTETGQKEHLQAAQLFLSSIGIRRLELTQVTPLGEASSVCEITCTPGLKTQFVKHRYAIEVPVSHYSSDGHKCPNSEQQYVWVRAPEHSVTTQSVLQSR